MDTQRPKSKKAGGFNISVIDITLLNSLNRNVYIYPNILGGFILVPKADIRSSQHISMQVWNQSALNQLIMVYRITSKVPAGVLQQVMVHQNSLSRVLATIIHTTNSASVVNCIYIGVAMKNSNKNFQKTLLIWLIHEDTELWPNYISHHSLWQHKIDNGAFKSSR